MEFAKDMNAGFAALAVFALSLTACGGSGSSKLSAPAKQYVALVSHLNKAHDEFNKATDDLDKKTAANGDYVAPIKAFVAAIHTFDSAMQAATWPASVKADVDTLAQADGKKINALERFATALTESPTADLEGLGNEMNAATVEAATAADVVRQDVGLPAPSVNPGN